MPVGRGRTALNEPFRKRTLRTPRWVRSGHRAALESGAYDQAVRSKVAGLTDNRARQVACYEPGYTLVEKLQTVSTKFHQQQASGQMPADFTRHDYDIDRLLADASARAFIGTAAYGAHKAQRFRAGDEPDLTINEAFPLSDQAVRDLYRSAYEATSALYYGGQPPFLELLARIQAAALQL